MSPRFPSYVLWSLFRTYYLYIWRFLYGRLGRPRLSFQLEPIGNRWRITKEDGGRMKALVFDRTYSSRTSATGDKGGNLARALYGQSQRSSPQKAGLTLFSNASLLSPFIIPRDPLTLIFNPSESAEMLGDVLFWYTMTAWQIVQSLPGVIDHSPILWLLHSILHLYAIRYRVPS